MSTEHHGQDFAACQQPSTQNSRAVYHRSRSDEWATPRDRFAEWTVEFGPFELDAAATHENALCGRYFTMEDDGLVQDWGTGTVWCNPPYSTVATWVEKAHEASLAGATVVMLVPSRTDTRWWHSWAVRAEVLFIKGRLKFGDAKNSAPFPSALLIFRPPNAPFRWRYWSTGAAEATSLAGSDHRTLN